MARNGKSINDITDQQNRLVTVLIKARNEGRIETDTYYNRLSKDRSAAGNYTTNIRWSRAGENRQRRDDLSYAKRNELYNRKYQGRRDAKEQREWDILEASRLVQKNNLEEFAFKNKKFAGYTTRGEARLAVKG